MQSPRTLPVNLIAVTRSREFTSFAVYGYFDGLSYRDCGQNRSRTPVFKINNYDVGSELYSAFQNDTSDSENDIHCKIAIIRVRISFTELVDRDCIVF